MVSAERHLLCVQKGGITFPKKSLSVNKSELKSAFKHRGACQRIIVPNVSKLEALSTKAMWKRAQEPQISQWKPPVREDMFTNQVTRGVILTLSHP